MNITTAIYSFHYNEVFVKVPFEIVRDLKSEINKPILKSATTYPYVELVMVDADEGTLREKLSEWFTNKAYEIWKM